jgi:hypothetical protein
MGWIIKSTGEEYEGPTHEFVGFVWSGKTKTTDSVKLIWEGGEEVLIEEAAPAPKRGRRKKTE